MDPEYNTVSRMHCRIVYDTAYGWLLKDGRELNEGQERRSTNGTSVQLNSFEKFIAHKKSESFMLKDKMDFNIAGYHFRVVQHGSDSPRC